jgi:hypothetical protein
MKMFQWEHNINIPFHVRDLQTYGDRNYTTPILEPYTHEDQDLAQPQWAFMQKILSGDYVANEHTSDHNEIISIHVNVINLDNCLESIYHHEAPFINLSNIPTL